MPSRADAKAFDARLRRQYGIGAADFAEMWQQQGGKCPICGKDLVRGRGKACVDHKHVPGYRRLEPKEKRNLVRGILCGMYCNKRVIGALERMGKERAFHGIIYLGWSVDLG